MKTKVVILIVFIITLMIVLSSSIGCSFNTPEPIIDTVIVVDTITDTIIISPKEITIEPFNQVVNIPIEYYLYYYFHVTDSVTLSANMNVAEGTQIDILLLTAENFIHFTYSQPFQSIAEGSELKVVSKTYTTVIPVGTYYIVVDNTSSMVPNGAIPSGEVNVNITISFTTYGCNSLPDINFIKIKKGNK
jgi:hypothetical protein